MTRKRGRRKGRPRMPARTREDVCAHCGIRLGDEMYAGTMDGESLLCVPCLRATRKKDEGTLAVRKNLYK